MLDNLSSRIQNIFSKITSRGILKEKDVDEALREVRLALLEADVHFKVVKQLISSIRERTVGKKVLENLNPGQQVIKIVNEELINILGKSKSSLQLHAKPPTIIMLAGLQGSGKTSATAKLALHLRKKGHRPIMVAADIYRPAAIEQLKVLGKELEIPVFSGEKNAVKICQDALTAAQKNGNDAVLIDTAGRLHIDDKMMAELAEIKKAAAPHQILLVVDSMTGQEAVNFAASFKEKINVDGLILTKMDSDARGGAALSINKVTGLPIKFITTGEKADAFEIFHPDRLAGRILGMGDVLSLIEKAQAVTDAKQAAELEKKLLKQEFTLDDLYEQLQQVRKMGPIKQVLDMIPGMNKMPQIAKQIDDKQLTKIGAIIQSMTKKERHNPGIINGSRRQRIASGSGTNVSDVNQLLKQYAQTKKLVAAMSKNKNPFKLGKSLPF